MKYKPELYAKAFLEALEAKTPEKEAVANFLSLIKKNGDLPRIAQIIAATEKVFRKSKGNHLVTIESARPLPHSTESIIKKLVQPNDTLEEKINPDLVAGIRITVDGEREYDGSLKRKLNALFK